MSDTDIEYSHFTGWADAPVDLQPRLEETTACDVAVVGGGLGGMATALRLAERGADVVLVESRFCGYGASSRNAGQLTGAPAGDPQLLNLLYRSRLPALVRFAEASVRFVEDLMQRLDIDCAYEPTGNVGAAVSPGQMRKAQKNAAILRRAGATVELGERSELGIPDGFLGGLLEPVGGTLNPGMLTLGIRRALLDSGVRVAEQTPVHRVDPTGPSTVISTPCGRVRADRVVLATNAYTGGLAVAPERLETPTWVSMVETAPIDSGRIAATGWTSRSGLATVHNLMESYRITPRNTIAFGVRRIQAAKGAPGERTSDPSVVADLARAFRSRFPALHDVPLERTWGGWIAMTPSWLPVAGETPEGVHYMIGCNGHGLSQAPYIGTLIADQISGKGTSDSLDAVWRQRSRFAPAPAFTAPALRAIWAADRLSDRLAQARRRTAVSSHR